MFFGWTLQSRTTETRSRKLVSVSPHSVLAAERAQKSKHEFTHAHACSHVCTFTGKRRDALLHAHVRIVAPEEHVLAPDAVVTVIQVDCSPALSIGWGMLRPDARTEHAASTAVVREATPSTRIARVPPRH